MEDRAQHGHVVLVHRPHPGVVAEEHVPVVDSRILAPVLEGPLNHEIHHASVKDDVRPHVDHVTVLVGDHADEIVGLRRDGRTRDLPNRRPDLVRDLPELVAEHLIGDGIDFRSGRDAMELHLPDQQLGRGLVAGIESLCIRDP